MVKQAHHIKLRKQNGFTLIELAMVFGVVGLITGAIWYAAASAGEAERSTQGVEEMKIVSQNILATMSGRTFPAGLPMVDITSSLIAANIIPSTYVNRTNPTTANDPWSTQGNPLNSPPSGSMRVMSMGGLPSFVIQYYGMTAKGCQALVSNIISCQAGTVGCPAIITLAGSSCTPGITGCFVGPATKTGWNVFTSDIISKECATAALTPLGSTSLMVQYNTR